MGKVLCFIYNDMADFELTLSTHFVGLYAKKEIVPIAYDINVIRSAPGMCYYPAATVKEALEYTDVEGLIIPGGWNDDQREELTELINKINNEGKLLTAICAGPQYLARAGVLEGKKYTTTLTEQVMKDRGVEDPFPRETFVPEKVVRDGNIITAVGSAFVDFAAEILDWYGVLENEEEKKEIAEHYKGL